MSSTSKSSLSNRWNQYLVDAPEASQIFWGPQQLIPLYQRNKVKRFENYYYLVPFLIKHMSEVVLTNVNETFHNVLEMLRLWNDARNFKEKQKYSHSLKLTMSLIPNTFLSFYCTLISINSIEKYFTLFILYTSNFSSDKSIEAPQNFYWSNAI